MPPAALTESQARRDALLNISAQLTEALGSIAGDCSSGYASARSSLNASKVTSRRPSENTDRLASSPSGSGALLEPLAHRPPLSDSSRDTTDDSEDSSSSSDSGETDRDVHAETEEKLVDASAFRTSATAVNRIDDTDDDDDDDEEAGAMRLYESQLDMLAQLARLRATRTEVTQSITRRDNCPLVADDKAVTGGDMKSLAQQAAEDAGRVGHPLLMPSMEAVQLSAARPVRQSGRDSGVQRVMGSGADSGRTMTAPPPVPSARASNMGLSRNPAAGPLRAVEEEPEAEAAGDSRYEPRVAYQREGLLAKQQRQRHQVEEARREQESQRGPLAFERQPNGGAAQQSPAHGSAYAAMLDVWGDEESSLETVHMAVPRARATSGLRTAPFGHVTAGPTSTPPSQRRSAPLVKSQEEDYGSFPRLRQPAGMTPAGSLISLNSASIWSDEASGAGWLPTAPTGRQPSPSARAAAAYADVEAGSRRVEHPNLELQQSSPSLSKKPPTPRKGWLSRWRRRNRDDRASQQSPSRSNSGQQHDVAAAPQGRRGFRLFQRWSPSFPAFSASNAEARPPTLPRGHGNTVKALIDQLMEGGAAEAEALLAAARSSEAAAAGRSVHFRQDMPAALAARPVAVHAAGRPSASSTSEGGPDEGSQPRACATATFGVALGPGDAPLGTGLEGSFVIRLELDALHILSPMRFRTLLSVGYHEMRRYVGVGGAREEEDGEKAGK